MERYSKSNDALLDAWRDTFLVALALTGLTMRFAVESFLGVAMSRLRVLSELYGGGELSQADLQRILEVDGATITRQVKQLEADGLALRRADPKDNRFTLVALTAAGRETFETLMARGREFEGVAMRDISAEQRAMATAVLEQIRRNLQSVAGNDVCAPSRKADAPG